MYAAGGAATVAIAVLGWAAFKPKPPSSPPLRVTARLAATPARTRIDGAAPSGPFVRIKGRLEPGTTEVKFSNGDPR